MCTFALAAPKIARLIFAKQLIVSGLKFNADSLAFKHARRFKSYVHSRASDPWQIARVRVKVPACAA